MSRKAIVRSVVALKNEVDQYIMDMDNPEADEFPYNLPELAQKDLSKIEFSTENIKVTPPGFCNYPCGFDVLENGLPVLFVNAGGDWEFPICFILYLDDKDRLRGYIPKRGNAYNKIKKSAYGNNPDTDPDPAGNDPCLKTDYEAIKEDIISRIKIVDLPKKSKKMAKQYA